MHIIRTQRVLTTKEILDLIYTSISKFSCRAEIFLKIGIWVFKLLLLKEGRLSSEWDGFDHLQQSLGISILSNSSDFQLECLMWGQPWASGELHLGLFTASLVKHCAPTQPRSLSPALWGAEGWWRPGTQRQGEECLPGRPDCWAWAVETKTLTYLN